MTCIVGVIERGRHVVLGTDSAGVSGEGLAIDLEEPKIWRDEEWLVGFSGVIAQQQTLRRLRFESIPDKLYSESDPEQQCLENWFERARAATGHTSPGSTYMGYDLLVARGTRLWLCGSSGHVLSKTRRGRMAVGTGGQFALGAMETFRGRDVPAAAIAEAGLRAACSLSSSCWLPGLFFTTGGESWSIRHRGIRFVPKRNEIAES